MDAQCQSEFQITERLTFDQKGLFGSVFKVKSLHLTRKDIWSTSTRLFAEVPCRVNEPGDPGSDHHHSRHIFSFSLSVCSLFFGAGSVS